jgi:hypothetical protein
VVQRIQHRHVSHRALSATAFGGVDEDLHGELLVWPFVDLLWSLQDVLCGVAVRSEAWHRKNELALPATFCHRRSLSLRPGALACELKVDWR